MTKTHISYYLWITMKIQLNRKNDASYYEGTSELSDVKVHIDGSADIGGEGKGVRPMELVLFALGSCSVFDLVHILKKQRQEIDDVQVNVQAERRETPPNIFTKIHIEFLLKGTIDETKAAKAAELAVKKYCSVHDMLAAGGVDITYSIKVSG